MQMVDMPLEFGGQGRTYLLKLCCVPAGVLFFFIIEYILMILPRILKVGVLVHGVVSCLVAVLINACAALRI